MTTERGGRWLGQVFPTTLTILHAKERKRELKPHLCLIRARIQTAPPGKHHPFCLSGRSCSPVANWVEHSITRARCSLSSLAPTQAVCHGQTSQSIVTRQQSEEGVESHLPDLQLMPGPPVSVVFW